MGQFTNLNLSTIAADGTMSTDVVTFDLRPFVGFLAVGSMLVT